MNCERANQMDLVAFLATIGYHPARIRGNDTWYLSPLHSDRTASFKVNTLKNRWFDFGLGKGGTLVDLVCMLHACSIPTALQIIASNSPTPSSLFHERKKLNKPVETGLKIIDVQDRITDQALKGYLSQRNIQPLVAKLYCKQVDYQTNRVYTAIGFKNNSGGYELRSPTFKGSSSPKFVTYYSHGSDHIKVFEGFMDFLSFQSMHNCSSNDCNFLILNSLSFFTRSILLMEKHQQIELYLDHDTMGDQCTKELQQRTDKVIDQRTLYKGFKDLNEWWSKQTVREKLHKGLRI